MSAIAVCMTCFLVAFAQAVRRDVLSAVDPWDLVVKTCDEEGAGTNAAVFLKVLYANHEHQTFLLDSARDDFEQGQKDHFRISLKRDDVYRCGLYWWPSGTVREELCISWALLINSALGRCLVAKFDTWIGIYSDPATYPLKFKTMDYASCVNAPAI